ncbi:TMV resistance protein N-like [Dorcoceras hygrometricum]|uniref:TMV resistance protein N-like n=1 Tax=Dorcoceras hygrometricum TaxID=472368 RepID=A0A2Z7AG09_9LAMI|nr:TMV resistance protein N-like [Dorcoceras hygrometricum]
MTPQHPTAENKSISKRPTAETLNNSNNDISGFPLTKVKRRRLNTSIWSLKPTADHSQRQRMISARTSAVNSAVDQHLTASRTALMLTAASRYTLTTELTSVDI